MCVKRPVEVLRGAVSAVRDPFSAAVNQSERTLLLGTVLLVSAVSAVVGYVLTQYYSVDVLSSLVSNPEDCIINWGPHIGRHCFSDYQLPLSWGMRPNPWEPYPLFMPPDFQPAHNNYPAAAMVPQLIFGLLGKWLSVPQLGLLGYLLVLTIAVLTPAVWAARGAAGLERVVVFVVCGAAAIPAWMVLDRANSVALLAPVGLVFLVALCRHRWGLVAIMVVLATLIKPQFAVLAVALFAARQWRMGSVAVAGAVTSSLAAYLLWPRNFPATITQSIHSTLNYGSPGLAIGMRNVSFGRALLLIPDAIKTYQTGWGKIPDGFLAGPRSLIGYAVLVLVVISVLAFGPRIPPVVVGIVLLATASLFPALVFHYYLVFVLPVAALVIRDPDGPPGTGVFDQLATHGGRRRAVGICVSLAVALSIAQVAVPSRSFPEPVLGQILGHPGVIGVVGTRTLINTTIGVAPILWLVACAVIIVSYARKPASGDRTDRGQAQESPPDSAVSTSSCTSEPESSHRGRRNPAKLAVRRALGSKPAPRR
jgi:hypothetical protein